jgi:hypothetical protein
VYIGIDEVRQPMVDILSEYFNNQDIINGLITADRFKHKKELKFIEYYSQYELFEHPSGRTLTSLVSEVMTQLEK